MNKNRQLRKLIKDNFKEGDLRDLCQSIGAPHTAYPTVDRNAFIRSLVSFVQAHKSVSHLDFIKYLKEVRPDFDWLGASEGSTPTRISPKLRNALKLNLSVENLMAVCFLMDIEHENLVGGTTPATNVIDIIQFASRRRLLPELVQKAKDIRPDLDWSELG